MCSEFVAGFASCLEFLQQADAPAETFQEARILWLQNQFSHFSPFFTIFHHFSLTFESIQRIIHLDGSRSGRSVACWGFATLVFLSSLDGCWSSLVGSAQLSDLKKIWKHLEQPWTAVPPPIGSCKLPGIEIMFALEIWCFGRIGRVYNSFCSIAA